MRTSELEGEILLLRALLDVNEDQSRFVAQDLAVAVARV